LDKHFFTVEENIDVNTERIRAREKIEQAQDIKLKIANPKQRKLN